jgi:hypothetical protein
MRIIIAEPEDFLQLCLHSLSENKRIQLLTCGGKGTFDRVGDIRRIQDSLIRSFWGIVTFQGFGPYPLFCDQFYRWAEEVVKQPPFRAIELIEERHSFGTIKPFISQPLPYMGPVFLLDVGVVILVVAPASGENNAPLCKMPHKMIVQELGAIVAVKPKQREGSDRSTSLTCSSTPRSPFPKMALCSVQLVAMSTKSMVLT